MTKEKRAVLATAKKLFEHTFDTSKYIVLDASKRGSGKAERMTPLRKSAASGKK